MALVTQTRDYTYGNKEGSCSYVASLSMLQYDTVCEPTQVYMWLLVGGRGKKGLGS